jgi:hypothetical protein
MGDLSEECLDILNRGHFRFVEPGPLHAPVHRFSLRRNDKFALVLETDIALDATSTAVQRPAGTVSVSTERAKLVSITGLEAEFTGVVPYSVRSAGDAFNRSHKETAKVYMATVKSGSAGEPTYIIDWLDNLPGSDFVWPDTLKTNTKTTTRRTFGLTDDCLRYTGDDEREDFARTAAKLTVSGITFYVCALDRGDGTAGPIKPGCILYNGTPDDAFRKKVRIALSFALGLYLVDLGHTVYDDQWHIVSALARSAYCLGGHAFDMGPEQLAPLGARYRGELNSSQLTRTVNGLVSMYDDLDLANLSWAYWHSCAATPHIAPAHFGAAIEALQWAFIRMRPNAVSHVWLPREPWKELRAAMAKPIGEANISEDAKAALVRGVASLNRVDQRPLLKAVMTSIGLRLGRDEDAAWKRRNNAAHGTPIPEGEELAAVRDMRLLKGLFHRMLLRIANAADQYIDYTSPDLPYRPIEEAPPESA